MQKRHAAAVTAFLFSLAPLACGGGEDGGQQGSPGQQSGQQATSAQQETSVSDEELRAFADATTQLREAAKSAKSRMQEAEGQEEARQVRAAFDSTRAEIVQEAGLDTARYTEIRTAIETDSDLRDRFMEIQGQAQP